MLHFFMTHPERVYSRAQLLDQVWGDHVFLEERTVDVHIRRLRHALSPTGHEASRRDRSGQRLPFLGGGTEHGGVMAGNRSAPRPERALR